MVRLLGRLPLKDTVQDFHDLPLHESQLPGNGVLTRNTKLLQKHPVCIMCQWWVQE